MAQKKITDLQLRSAVVDTLNFPSDDTLQSYRVTASQIYDYLKAKLLTTTGDMIYSSSGSTPAKLAIGSAQQIIRPVAGVPAWAWPYAVQRSATSTDSINATTDHVLLYSASGAAFTATLPTAASVAGKMYIIKKTDSTFNAVTISTVSSQTIDGSGTSTTLNTQNESIVLFSDGTNWQILDRRIPSIRTSYTPTFTGLGTPTNVEFYWWREGTCICVQGKLTTGTVSAAKAAISLPSGVTAFTSPGASPYGVGFMFRNTNTSSNYKQLSVTMDSAGTGFNFGLWGIPTDTNDPFAAGLGNAIFVSSSAYYGPIWKVPVAGWNG